MTGAQTRIISLPVSGGVIEAELRDGAGAAVVFLHGWTLDRRMWAPQLSGLKTARRLIAIDRRGFGRSTAPPDMITETDDIAAVLDHIGAAKAVVVGMSQSGRVAVDFALIHRDRISGLVLQGARLGPAESGGASEDIPLDEYTALVRAGKLSEMKALWREHRLMHVENADVQSTIDMMLTDYDGRDLLAGLTRAPDFSELTLADIAVPALIVTGDRESKPRRLVADNLARVLPKAQRIEIAGASHLCNLCAPDFYNAALSTFLESIAA